jgi:hypothetical protein
MYRGANQGWRLKDIGRRVSPSMEDAERKDAA